jgi:hypothetical protein
MEFMYWKEVVKKHTTCDLTFSKDKVVNLSGVASELQVLLGLQYAEGTWKDHLPRCLLWSTTHLETPVFRPQEYVAPTWSQASDSKRNRIP